MARTSRRGPRKPASQQEISALASAPRLRMLRLTRYQALTNQELAQRLGLTPGATLYHIRRLVAAGLLEPQEPRTRATGGIEIPYRSYGRSWTLDIDESAKPTSAMLEAFIDEVREIGAGHLEHAIRLRAVLSRQRRRELIRRLYELFDEYADNPDPDGEPWSGFFALHPDPSVADRD